MSEEEKQQSIENLRYQAWEERQMARVHNDAAAQKRAEFIDFVADELEETVRGSVECPVVDDGSLI